MPPKKEEFAYGSVLEALSRGLYPDKRHVLREFVQNSFDSLSELKRHSSKSSISPIEIRIDPPSIFIGDRGFGMRADQVRQYRYLGFSEKQPSTHAGFRGIGKYSAIAVAEKIIVDSSPLGEPKRYRAVIHADKMMDLLRKEKNQCDVSKKPLIREPERTQLQAEDAVAESEKDVYVAVIALYKALGGVPS